MTRAGPTIIRRVAAAILATVAEADQRDEASAMACQVLTEVAEGLEARAAREEAGH